MLKAVNVEYWAVLFLFMRVWKADIPKRHGVYQIDLPKSCQLTKCEVQGSKIGLWLLASDDTTKTEKVTIEVVRTGFELKSKMSQLIGSLADKGQTYHIFEATTIRRFVIQKECLSRK